MPKAINICADEARKFKKLPDNTVLISINQQYGDLYPLNLKRDSSRILTVRFDDITGKIVDGRTGLIYTPMGEETALKILNFINVNYGKDFIIHCHAGISRSAAICLYLNIMEGYELKKNFWSLCHPNYYVLGKLIVVRKRKILYSELIQ
jgi:predicted protein tyrosine phosphatase